MARTRRCANCAEPVPADVSELRLRAEGWHFYDGKNYGGTRMIHRALCPICLRNKQLPKNVVMEDQQELF